MDTLEKIRADLPEYKYSDYLKNLPLAEEACAGARPLRVAVLRSYTVEAIEPVLRLRLLLEGFEPEIFFGGYNQYVQEVLDESSALYAFRPDVVLLMIRLEELMPDLVETFGDRESAAWSEVVESSAAEVANLAQAIRARTSAQVVLQNFTPPEPAYWGVYDAQIADGQGHQVARLNRSVAERFSAMPGAFIWDFDHLVRRRGYDQIFDPKMWYFSKNPYKQAVYPYLVDDLLRYLLSILGRSKKCVVLDLDNTLWGGIVGEDGLEGIELGHAYPGLCYRELQKALLRLHRRGVILAVNSKNNEADALEVIDSHPDMVLRREHFSAMQINWQDKASNMRALAETLNIGLDSMILVDDNPVECEQVRQLVPECEVVCLPKQPYLLPGVVDSLPGLDNIRLTAEDKSKGEMYRAEAARKEEEKSFGSLEDFLEGLELAVSIDAAAPYSIPRIAQLTQKTNQMNVTTRRYTETDIGAMAEKENMAVFSVAAKDRFGDNGIVGVFILDVAGDDCRIDTLLLSCRVIGRHIERAMIDVIADVARSKGATALIGEFLPTPRNKPAEGLFERLGFERIDDTTFRVALEDLPPQAPPYIDLAVNAD